MKSKLKILFTDHTPLYGGAQIAILRHINHLDTNKFTPIFVISPDTPGFSKKARISLAEKLYEIAFPQLKPFGLYSITGFLTSVRKLISIARQERPDIYVANVERAFYVTFIVALIFRKPLILIIRDFEFSHILLKLTRFKVSHYLVVSKKIQDFYTLPERKTSVIYVGSDMYKRVETVTDEAVHRNRAQLVTNPGNSFIVGFVGRMIEWKGPFLILEALKRIVEQFNSLDLPYSEENIKFVFLGTGPDENRFRERIVKHKLETYVYYPGFDPNTPLWYKTFDCYIHASIEDEPYATTMIEAAQSRTAIIGTNTGGTPEFVVDRETGILIEPTVNDLYNAIVLLMKDQNLRRELEERAYHQAISNNTEEAVSAIHMQLYLSLCKRI